MIAFGPDQCRRLDEALPREWLVANGLGGYAAATIPGLPTRRYHGLLVAALPPPAGRTVLLNQLEELVTYAGRAYQVSTTEYEGGTLAPAGFIHLNGFRLEDGLPVTHYEVGDTLLEKRVWMAHGRNTTYVRYRLAETASEPVELRLRPLISGRPLHWLVRGGPHRWPRVTPIAEGCRVELAEPAAAVWLRLVGGWLEAQPDWYWRLFYRRERERGLDSVEDLFTPGVLAVTLRPGRAATLVVAAEAAGVEGGDPEVARRLEYRRRSNLLHRAALPPDDGFGRALALAADAFLVTRSGPVGAGPATARRSVIAGYPWLDESGRDALIALPGLMLATGRATEARAFLQTWIGSRRDGLLPVRVSETAGQVDYASADTTLWLFVALRAYLRQTNDVALLAKLWPALVEIIAAHERGTRFGIQVDPDDGLLRAGETGHQLTWMDARAGDRVVTPRRGKPVEINALWYNALRQMAGWAEHQTPERAETYGRAAERVAASFHRRYWYAPGGYLYDVIDAEAGNDQSLRPNQILAIGLPFAVLAPDRWRPVLDAVTDHLLTPYGLRTLSPVEPHYVGWYAGDAIHRDSAHHQGTVAPWLLGPYGDAYRRVYGGRVAVRDRLQAFEKHLKTAGLGTISEIFDGDLPHSPQGCIAHAASVGEVLRLWRAVTGPAGDDEG